MQTEIAPGLAGVLRLGRLLEAARATVISLMNRNNCGKALDVARFARECMAVVASRMNFT